MQIRSPQELDELLEANPSKLVCMMCKAIGCRPCKVMLFLFMIFSAANLCLGADPVSEIPSFKGLKNVLLILPLQTGVC